MSKRRNKNTEVLTGVTGRDGYIFCKALAYAIEAINRLPPEWQQVDEQQDMLALFNWVASADRQDKLRLMARAHLERRGTTTIDGQVRLAGRDGKVISLTNPCKVQQSCDNTARDM